MKTAYYITDQQYFEKQNQGIAEYQGWTNSITCIFNLYFLQEQPNYKALNNLIRKDGTINRDRAIKLFNRAYIKVDDWCEGYVNVNEILEYFESGFQPVEIS